VSPVIVRTIEVPAGVSLVQLHRMFLACFGWSGDCLHVIEIRGCSCSNSGYVDAERSSNVSVGSLGLRVGERFCWRYDFCSDWIIDAVLEACGCEQQLEVPSCNSLSKSASTPTTAVMLVS
jgi:hypothetical protein